MTQPSSLETRSLSSFRWSAAGEILSRSLQPLLIVIVGAMITPAEFGLLAIATIVLGVGQLLQDMGLGKTLVQRNENVTECADHVFWMNTGLSALLFCLAWGTAPMIAGMFRAPESTWIIRVLNLRLVVTAVGLVQQTLLQRELAFKSLFLARLAAALTASATTIPLAFAGHGVWSLVWGMLAGGSVQSALLWLQSAWRPSLHWNHETAESLLRFSKWILLESLLAAAIQWGDAVIVAHYLGTQDLGKFRMAGNLVGFVTGLLLAPLAPVALSWLSRLQTNKPEFSRTLTNLTRVATMISFPAGFGLAVLAGPIVTTVLGPQWAGTEVVIVALGIKLAIDWLVGFNSAAMTASGRPDLNAKLLSAVCAFSLPLFVLSAPLGLATFATVRLLAAGLDNALSIAVARRVLGRRLQDVARSLWPALPATMAMLAATLATRLAIPHNGTAGIALQVATGCTAYVAVAVGLDRTILWTIWSPFRRANTLV